jgi:hypothetical protein
MNRSWFKLIAVCAVAVLLPNCGANKQLVSITVSPSGANITGAGLNLQFTAVGNYIHPPVTQDITNTVVWKSSADQIISFSTPNTPGLATSGLGCGTNIPVTATVYSNPSNPPAGTAIIGTATVSVKQVNDPNCP